MKNESTDTAIDLIEQIFYERGPPQELLTDNGPCYRSDAFCRFMAKWNIDHIFSCAYRQQGNGIAERHHRTIKRMVARTKRSVQEMLFWYNFSTKTGNATPAESVHRYAGQSLPEVCGNSLQRQRDTNLSPFNVGDKVYVKPANARCTTTWEIGEVTALVSNTAVKVGSTPRHVSDLRLCHPRDSSTVDAPAVTLYDVDCDVMTHESEAEGDVASEHHDAESHQVQPPRTRKPPQRYGNIIYDMCLY